MNWPLVYVIFATHKRTEASLRTLDSLREYLKYPNLHLHIASDGSRKTDDGTNREHIQVLLDSVRQWNPGATGHEIDTPLGRFNTGYNINLSIRNAIESGCSIYMLNFDDWALTRELDIRPMVDVLDHEPKVGFIRLSYHVPGHGMLSVRYDCPRLNAGWMWLRIIRQWSLNNPWERDSYLISTQPYVAHIRFHEVYGWHPENVSPGHAETGLSAQYANYTNEDGPQVLFPIGVCTTHAPWAHLVGRANSYKELFG